jgi:hypothetical protein
VLVTDDYPGDHRHHHGIWSAWAHTHFEGRAMDFWNMGGGSAKVDFESLASSWDGPSTPASAPTTCSATCAGTRRR